MNIPAGLNNVDFFNCEKSICRFVLLFRRSFFETPGILYEEILTFSIPELLITGSNNKIRGFCTVFASIIKKMRKKIHVRLESDSNQTWGCVIRFP